MKTLYHFEAFASCDEFRKLKKDEKSAFLGSCWTVVRFLRIKAEAQTLQIKSCNTGPEHSRRKASTFRQRKEYSHSDTDTDVSILEHSATSQHQPINQTDPPAPYPPPSPHSSHSQSQCTAT
jgi:hypothetical protein